MALTGKKEGGEKKDTLRFSEISENARCFVRGNSFQRGNMVGVWGTLVLLEIPETYSPCHR